MHYKHFVVTTLVCLATNSVFADCARPDEPKIPSGGEVSEAELITAQKSVKEFVSLGNKYLECLGDEEAKQKLKLKELDADSEEAAGLVEQSNARLKKYNNMVDVMQDVGARFNAEVKRFKAATTN